MEIYLRLSDETRDDNYDARERPERQCLPRVLYPCGHELWFPGALPLESQPPEAIRKMLRPAGRSVIIPPERWPEVSAQVAGLYQSAGRSVPPIFPGQDLGQLQLRIDYDGTLPDLFSLMNIDLFSERALQAFEAAGLTGYEAYEVVVEAKPSRKTLPPLPRLFELVPFGRAQWSPEAEMVQEKCPVCGKVLEFRCKALVIDPASWNGGDFIAPEGLKMYYSERVRQVAEDAGLDTWMFIPGSKFGYGPGVKSASDVASDMRFDRQMAERRKSLA